MKASVKKKSKPKSDKVATNNNNNNKQQQTTIFFCQKKKSIFETNFTKSEGKVRFGQIFFWKWSSWRAKSDATKQKILSFQEVGQKRKIVVKIEFTPLSLDQTHG